MQRAKSPKRMWARGRETASSCVDTNRALFLSLTFHGGLNEASGQNLAKMNIVDRSSSLVGVAMGYSCQSHSDRRAHGQWWS